MENFNYYMTFSPKEFEYGIRELILEKRIPLDLYLENYEVCLTEFTSASITEHMPYIEISGIFDSELTNLTDFFNAVAIPLDNNKTNEINDIYISKQIMTYFYFFTHQLFYNYTTIKSIAPNLVFIIYH